MLGAPPPPDAPAFLIPPTLQNHMFFHPKARSESRVAPHVSARRHGPVLPFMSAMVLTVFLALFGRPAVSAPAPNSRVRVLIYGYLNDGAVVRDSLEALLREDYETVEVDFQAPPGQMLHDSYYRTDMRELVKSHLKTKAYDYTVIADNEAMAVPYPEFWYNGVTAVAARAREFSNARTLLWIGSSGGIENGYRVANGTGSLPLPVCRVLEQVGAAASLEKSFAGAAAVYSQITGKSAATSGAVVAGISPARMAALAGIAAETLQTERGVPHYTTPFKGAVWIHGGPIPASSQFGYIYTGTSTEVGMSGVFGADLGSNLLRRADLIAVPSRVGSSLSFGADATATSAKTLLEQAPGRYHVAYARIWSIQASQLTSVEPNLQCQIFDRHADATISGLNNFILDGWITGRYSSAKTLGLAWLPLHLAIFRYNERCPEVTFSSDGTHMTAEYLQLLASMSYTSRTGLKAPVFGLDAASAAAVDEGFKIIRQLSMLSDSGDYVPDSPQANRPPTLDPLADSVVMSDAARTLREVRLTGITPGSPYEDQSLSVRLASDNEALIPTSSLELADLTYPRAATPGAPGGATLRFHPAAGASGRCRIAVTLDDGQPANSSVTRSFEVEITANQSPTLDTVAPLIIEEDTPAFIQVTGVGSGDPGSGQALRFFTRLPGVSTDPVASVDVLSFDEEAGTANVKITPRAEFPWSPALGRSQTFKLYADNGRRVNFLQSTDITVTVNPVNDFPTLNAIADVTKNEDAPQFTVDLRGITAGGREGEGGQTVTVTAVSGNPALLPDPVVNYQTPNASGSLSFSLAPNASGDAAVTVRVDDGQAQTVRRFTVKVNPVNDAPALDPIPSLRLAGGAGLTRLPLTGISAGPLEPQALTVTVTSSNAALVAPSVVYASPDATGALEFTPAPGKTGSAEITVRVSDGALSATQSFVVAVDAPMPPTLNGIANLSLREDAPGQTVSLSGIGAGPGNPSTTLVVTATSRSPALVPSPTLAYVSPDAAGTLALKPVENVSGSAVIDVRVQAASGATLTRSFTVAVAAVNDAPTFLKGPDQVVAKDAARQSVAGWASAISAGPTAEASQVLAFTLVNTDSALFSEQPALSPQGTLTYQPAPGKTGSAVVTAVLKDNGGVANSGVDSSPPQFFTITVTDLSRPAAVAQSVGAFEDTPKALVVSGIAAARPIASYNLTQPARGTLSGVAPNLTYTPAANFNGTDSFTFTVTDDSGAVSLPATVSITVAAVNDAPGFTKGANQTALYNATQRSVTNWATAMSAGPADESAQTLAFVLTNSDNALFSVQPAVSLTGALTFTPAPGKSGTATVTVALKDNGGVANAGTDTSAPQTFTITVSPNAAPTATAQGVNALEDVAKTLRLSAADADGRIVRFNVTRTPLHGTLEGVAPDLTYTPHANFSGNDGFAFTVTDDNGAVSAPGAVSIAVAAVNDPPGFAGGPDQTVAMNAPAQTVAGWAREISVGPSNESKQKPSFAVTANSNPALFATQAAVSPGGILTYEVAAGKAGSAAVTLVLSDDGGGMNTSAPQIFTINVLGADLPVAVAQALGTLEDTPRAVVLSGIHRAGLTGSFTYNVTTPANGALSGEAPNLVYTPNANFNGSDSVTFTVTDSAGAVSLPATLSITVAAVSDPPTLGPLPAIALNLGTTSFSVPLTEISSGAPNERESLTVSAASSNPALLPNPVVAYVSPNATGSLSLLPVAGASGTAEIRVSVNDGVNAAVTRRFVVAVTSPPVAMPQSVTAVEDVSKEIILAGNDPDGRVIAYQVTTVPEHGTVSGTWPAVTYTPAQDFNGTDSFAFTVTDDAGAVSAPAIVGVTVTAVNDAPGFVRGAHQTCAFNAGPQTAGGWASGIRSGPSDESAQSLGFVAVNDNNALFASQPFVSSNGTLAFTPAAGQSGSATVTVSLRDDGGTANGGRDTSAPETFTITVLANRPPEATPLLVSAVEDAAKAITLAGSDEDGRIESFHVSAAPVNGTLSGTWPNVTYKPKADFNGADSFAFTVTDDAGAVSAPVTVGSTVAAVNDAPAFVKGADQAVAFNSGRRTVERWATDIRSGPADESAQTRTFNVNADRPELFAEPPEVSSSGVLTFTPAAGKLGSSTVTVSLRDNGGTADGGVDTSAAQSFTVILEGIASAPPLFDPIGDLTLTEDAAAQGVAITGIVAGTGRTLSASSDNPSVVPAPEVVYAGGSGGTLVMKPAADASGSARITVTLSGGAAGEAPFSRGFSVAVAAVNDAPSFEAFGDVVAGKELGAQSLAWASVIKSGPADESTQQLAFETVVLVGAELFDEAPAVSADGVLSYRPKKNAAGRAALKVRLRDNGGVAGGGADTSDWKSFSVALTDVSLLAGSYNGLLSASVGSEPAYARSGRLNVELRKTGSFTTRLELGGDVFSASGTIDNLGRPKFGRTRSGVWMIFRRNASPLAVELALETASGSDRITARVAAGDSTWAEGVAERRVAPGAVLVGPYTVVMAPSPEPPPGRPTGQGWATLNVQAKGGVRLAGRLADGTSLSCSGYVSKQSRWPLHGRPTSVSTKAGLVSGWVQFADRPSVSDIEGSDLRWFRFAMPRDRRFPGGWSEGAALGLLGSRYTAPTANGSRPLLTGLSPTGNNLRLTLTGGDRQVAQNVEFALRWPYTLRSPAIVFTVDRSTGRFSGTLAGTKDRKPMFSGVIFQKQNLGGGFWLSAESAGRLDLEGLAPGGGGF